MTAGLPGTGIGGFFYLVLALSMPVCELFRLIKNRTTTLRRWGFIALQLGFVFGIIGLIWAEVWMLNQIIMWLGDFFGINLARTSFWLGNGMTLHQAKLLTYASASGSFLSLGFVYVCVHILRVAVRREKEMENINAVGSKDAPGYTVFGKNIQRKVVPG